MSNTAKKIYYGEDMVGMAMFKADGGGSSTPSAFTEWEYDDYGRPTNIVVKNGVTSLPQYWQRSNPSLSSCTVPNSVESIGIYAFAEIYGSLDISNISLSGITASTSCLNYTFIGSYLKGNITIPSTYFSYANSGYTSSLYYMFENCVTTDTVTINAYCDGNVIPRHCFAFQNIIGFSDGLNLIIHGTPTFLSPVCIRCSSGGSVTFADCTTPPDASAYSGISSPFYNFNGTLYVPSAGLSAWQTKYSAISSQIKAIGT